MRITEREVGTTQLVQPDAVIKLGVQLMVHDWNDLFIFNLLFSKTPANICYQKIKCVSQWMMFLVSHCLEKLMQTHFIMR